MHHPSPRRKPESSPVSLGIERPPKIIGVNRHSSLSSPEIERTGFRFTPGWQCQTTSIRTIPSAIGITAATCKSISRTLIVSRLGLKRAPPSNPTKLQSVRPTTRVGALLEYVPHGITGSVGCGPTLPKLMALSPEDNMCPLLPPELIRCRSLHDPACRKVDLPTSFRFIVSGTN